MLEWLERKTKSAYLKKLEDDNARLTDELRQLMNSVLLSHNMPGIAEPQTKKPTTPILRPSWINYRREKERQAAQPQPAPEKPDAAA